MVLRPRGKHVKAETIQKHLLEEVIRKDLKVCTRAKYLAPSEPRCRDYGPQSNENIVGFIPVR